MSEVAAEHLRAELRPKRFVRARMFADALLGSGNVVPIFDLFVLRLDTGAVVVRMPADAGDPYSFLGQVELDLEMKTLEEFLLEWKRD